MAIAVLSDVPSVRVPLPPRGVAGLGLTRRTLHKGLLAGALAAPVGGLVAGCGGESSRSEDGSDEVTFLTTFGTQGRDCYAYVADAKGFFRDAGIKVAIQPGKAGDYNHLQLRARKADFAVVDASGALVRFATGADRAFRIIGAVHQSTLISIVTLADSGITRPADLVGRTFGTAPGAVPQTLFPAYARLAGVDPRGVRWQNAEPAQLNTLLASGRVDGIGVYIVSKPGVEAAARKPAVALPYSEFMTDMYGGVVVASEGLVSGNPDLCRRFTRALLRGLEYAVNHPEEAGEILSKRVPGQNPAVAAAEVEMMRPYVLPASGAPIGSLDPARVVRSVASLQSVGLVPSAAAVDTPNAVVAFDITPKG